MWKFAYEEMSFLRGPTVHTTPTVYLLPGKFYIIFKIAIGALPVFISLFYWTRLVQQKEKNYQTKLCRFPDTQRCHLDTKDN